MKKSAIGSRGSDQPGPADEWMDLGRVARVEVSSEEPEHPVEAALIPGRGTGWRASRPGPQTVRLVFAGPRHVCRIRLRFAPDAVARTQEFVLRWVDASSEPREVVRQQWNFAAGGSAEEVEDYRVDLPGVIDFALSNCINSRLFNILALTQYKSLSLEHHIAQGWGRFFHPEFGQWLTVASPPAAGGRRLVPGDRRRRVPEGGLALGNEMLTPSPASRSSYRTASTKR